jgi:hypothetical protein
METKLEKKRRRIFFSSGHRLMFSQMDKFQCWVINKDVTWAKSIGLFGLMTFKLTPMRHLVIKKFLQLIVWETP